MVNNSPIVDLAEIGVSDLGAVGGKALNLGRMQRAGLPVPPGFCVTTAAYDQVIGDRLTDTITALTDRAASPDDRARLAGEAREIITSTPMPDELTSAIASHYASLGTDVPVAVRSSATAEDLPGASFAGQQDTYLNVVGVDAVVDATRRCWASLWTERAVSYRESQGIDHAGVSLAVVTQNPGGTGRPARSIRPRLRALPPTRVSSSGPMSARSTTVVSRAVVPVVAELFTI